MLDKNILRLLKEFAARNPKDKNKEKIPAELLKTLIDGFEKGRLETLEQYRKFISNLKSAD